MKAYHQLEALFSELHHLDHASTYLKWDEAVTMPSKGGLSRANALTTLSKLHHEKLTTPHIKTLISEALECDSLNPWQSRNLQLIKLKYEHAICLPSDLVEKINHQSVLCEQAWRVARAHNDWKSFEPLLSDLFSLIKSAAEIKSQQFHMSPYDTQLDQFSPDLTQALINPLFDELTTTLPALIDTIIQKQSTQSIIELQGPFDQQKQHQLTLLIMKHIGFDFERGRIDTTFHPFSTGYRNDTRICTNYHTDDFLKAFFSTCHETGHACYTQNEPSEWQQQPVGRDAGMLIHESQSLIIEMPACRSHTFIEFILPHVSSTFGNQAGFTPENLTRIINHVEKSPIRIFADQVTYPLHVIIRYEIERDLFSNKISIKDLPEIWDSKMQQYLGISTKNDYKNGVMQDVHWASGAFGYFPAYTLGRLAAQQFFDTAIKTHPQIPAELKQGNFTSLMSWLNKNVHSKGSFLSMQDLIIQATGAPLGTQAFLNYIRLHYDLNEGFS